GHASVHALSGRVLNATYRGHVVRSRRSTAVFAMWRDLESGRDRRKHAGPSPTRWEPRRSHARSNHLTWAARVWQKAGDFVDTSSGRRKPEVLSSGRRDRLSSPIVPRRPPARLLIPELAAHPRRGGTPGRAPATAGDPRRTRAGDRSRAALRAGSARGRPGRERDRPSFPGDTRVRGSAGMGIRQAPRCRGGDRARLAGPGVGERDATRPRPRRLGGRADRRARAERLTPANPQVRARVLLNVRSTHPWVRTPQGGAWH